MAARCEDFPCCGHTLEDPCDAVIPDYSNRENQAKYHIGCDHEAGYCEYLPDEEEEEYEDDYEGPEENEDADFDVEEYDEQEARLNALRGYN